MFTVLEGTHRGAWMVIVEPSTSVSCSDVMANVTEHFVRLLFVASVKRVQRKWHSMILCDCKRVQTELGVLRDYV